jgi:hypothetical protein
MPQPTPTDTPTLHHARPGLVVHGALRRELGLAGPLVRRVADGDTARAAVVATHLDLVLRMLREHHETEDEGVWPALQERIGQTVLPMLALMDAQHVRIAELIRTCEARSTAWVDTAGTGAGEQLAAGLDELRSALADHLDVEERELFGLAEQHLTPEEWREMGARAQAAFTGRERTLVLGILEHDADPAVIAQMLAAAPAPVRFLVPRLARRAFRRHAAAVHGTPTP